MHREKDIELSTIFIGYYSSIFRLLSCNYIQSHKEPFLDSIKSHDFILLPFVGPPLRMKHEYRNKTSFSNPFARNKNYILLMSSVLINYSKRVSFEYKGVLNQFAALKLNLMPFMA